MCISTSTVKEHLLRFQVWRGWENKKSPILKAYHWCTTITRCLKCAIKHVFSRHPPVLVQWWWCACISQHCISASSVPVLCPFAVARAAGQNSSVWGYGEGGVVGRERDHQSSNLLDPKCPCGAFWCYMDDLDS